MFGKPIAISILNVQLSYQEDGMIFIKDALLHFTVHCDRVQKMESDESTTASHLGLFVKRIPLLIDLWRFINFF